MLLLMAARPVSAQDNTERKDSLVRLMKASSISLVEEYGTNYRKAFDATFLHNGTYLICDTALWNVENKVIHAYGHVQVIQDETILTSEKLDYLIDDNLAQFRGGVVQLQNKKLNTLRTRHLDYNTKDSLAVFRQGASMRDEDGQIIESNDGTYDSSKKLFTFSNNVNMFTDSVFVRTQLLEYDSDASRADFLKDIDFWKDGNMLSAGSGWYDRGRELFFFTKKVHGMGKTQEMWSDSLYYYRNLNDLELLGHAQVQDTSRNAASLSDYLYYQDTLSRVTLRKNAAVALFTEADSGRDTLYIGADVLVYQTERKCDISEAETDAAQKRRNEIFIDPVSEYRQKAAQAAAQAAKDAAEEAAKNDPALAAKRRAEELMAQREAAAKEAAAKEAQSLSSDEDTLLFGEENLPFAVDSLSSYVDTLSPGEDSLSFAEDSLSVDADSLSNATDSLSLAADSLSLAADSLSLAADTPDTTKVGFVTCLGNVKIFRNDIQARCDSLIYNDLDSIARLYIDPMVWNDGNRQYNSDSIFVLVRDGGVDRASLLSNAFIMVQEDSSAFDQIRGSEVMAYFDSTSALRRFDALGGASALFYLKEEEALATVNKVASKMLSANLSNGEVERVYYYEEPKNDAYPRAQLSTQDSRMKGFNWQPELKPRGKRDITTLTLRASERKKYERHPRASFKQTDIYFPGYMQSVYRGIAIRDSLRNLPPSAQESLQDTLAMADSVLTVEAAVQDSTGLEPVVSAEPADTVASPDSLPQTLETSVTDVDQIQDSVAVKSQAELRAEQAAARKAEAAAKKAKALAEKEAKWARLDSLDSLKISLKQQKIAERKREKTRRSLILKMRQDKRDQNKLERYIKIYERKKSRDERKRTR